MPDYTITEQRAGVDWITVSAAEGKRAELLREYGIELMMHDAEKGNKVGPFHRGVYYGGGTKHIGCGEWHGRALVEVSGRLADDEWPELVALADKCSRIDLQVSVRQDPYDKMLALRTWAKSLVASNNEGRPPDYDLYARRGQGSTLYIGEGASRYRARLYERWWKEKIPENENTWRYEVQARRERATQATEILSATPATGPTVESFVYQHFARRGVQPIFRSDLPLEVKPLPEPETDDDKSARWLTQSVAPVIRRLERRGKGDKWRRALGLDAEDVDNPTEG